MNYELFDEKGELAAEGHKASFCLEDTRCSPGFPYYYSCLGDTQGVSVGCADYYARRLDCQWIDVTSVWKQRTYYLRITVNPNQLPRESDFKNNVVQCKLFFEEDTFTLLDKCRNLGEFTCASGSCYAVIVYMQDSVWAGITCRTKFLGIDSFQVINLADKKFVFVNINSLCHGMALCYCPVVHVVGGGKLVLLVDGKGTP